MARIYLWSYPRDQVPPELDAHSLIFWRDLMKRFEGVSGIELECGFCHRILRLLDGDDQQTCPYCDNDLIFPRCDW